MQRIGISIHGALGVIVLCNSALAERESGSAPIELFGGKDLSGWVNVNCAADTWSVRDGIIFCTGHPTGVLRTEKMYENFVLELDWRHAKQGGNAGLFVHSAALPHVGKPFTPSVEVQVMDGDHGSIFGIQGVTLTPLTNPRGDNRARPTEERCHPGGSGKWNHYRLTSRDGRLDLEVNGKLVTRVKDCSQVKGYICLESEGSEVHFRNLRLTPLPSSNPSPDKVAAADEGFVSLFDGLAFDNWKLAPGSEGHWEVQRGVIDYDGGSTAEDRNDRNLWSERSFRDFSLMVDWRLTRKPRMERVSVFSPEGDRTQEKQQTLDAGDSGIYLRGTSKCQVNIWCQPMGSGEVHGFMVDKSLPTEIRSSARPVSKADNPPGRWNRFLITMIEDRITVRLNDQTVIDRAKLPGVPREGPIALQHHTDPIQFRNLFVKVLD